jgi:ATP-dependent Clp endopeptidase proteolytic subunit ClpP
MGPQFGRKMNDGDQKVTKIEPKIIMNTGSQPQILDKVENTIYFYSPIDSNSVLSLNKNLHSLNNDLIYQARIQKREPADIWLYINSYGGYVFDGFSAMDTILNSEVKINTIVDGACASAATFLSVVGHKRYIKKHSYILIHQLSSTAWGNYEQIKDEVKNLDKFMKMLKEVYKQYTKIPMKKIDEILKHDIWFSANEALTYGLVDEII